MIRLHHVPQSRSMRTLWLLHELGVAFEVVEWPFDKTLRSAEFLALNPAGRVPALELDGVRLWETGAITEILCERFPEAGMGRAPGHAERADWLIWVHFSETISQHVAALTQQHEALYEDHMRSPVVMKIEARRIEKCYQAIEERLAGRAYLLDGGFSAADISVGQAVYMARHFARLEPFAAAAAWYDRITARPGFKASLPAGRGLYTRDYYEAWSGEDAAGKAN
ncbi:MULTISPECIES: glutathione S-transferase family protein [Paracoccaceae]|jgi:glutathione S-transferase|uniref:glutathione S-transferase family protein n=1 Tax=Rhodobacterales TaxID=204455 RepID=UPI001B16190F|nr:glutathione S-transferase family protein [Boseongicola sp. H5]MBO6602920.1 glutathione S-transferase family protein [Roseicyclus sp.]MBO6625185.1 glutathione S-transferase family protein [Roseicyclus sp.]MBO6923999.1 glutathione S-transferase family protein [Roseicyclus sp.]